MRDRPLEHALTLVHSLFNVIFVQLVGSGLVIVLNSLHGCVEALVLDCISPMLGRLGLAIIVAVFCGLSVGRRE